MQLMIDKLSEQYHVDAKKLTYFADHDLIKKKYPYNAQDEKRLGIVCSLYDIGLNAGQIKRFLSLEDDRKEQIKLLHAMRNSLMKDIHARQKSLDQLDYILYGLKNNK